MNFVVQEKLDLFRSYYIYVDNKNDLANKLFKDNNIKVRSKKIWDCLDTDYKVILASVSNKKDYLFVKAMCELEDEMLEQGFNDYEEICKKYLPSKTKKKVKHV